MRCARACCWPPRPTCRPCSDTSTQVAPDLLVVDSVQTVASDAVDGAAGNVSQVREVAASLIRVAKARSMATVLVGHVTKDGAIAGPRVLEHLVDVVCQFEGDRQSRLRMVRAVKNRYGPTDEVGCFDLSDTGIVGLADPSGLFLSRHAEPVPGTCVTVTLEGRRPLVTEVQALVAPSAAVQPPPGHLRPGLQPGGDGAGRAGAPGRGRAGRAGHLRGHRRRGTADRTVDRPRGRAGRGQRRHRPAAGPRHDRASARSGLAGEVRPVAGSRATPGRGVPGWASGTRSSRSGTEEAAPDGMTVFEAADLPAALRRALTRPA